MEPKLYFIYNADSGLGNALVDVGRRFVQPKDYPCALCLVTYGPFGMKKDWKAFLATLPYESVFLHKDEAGQLHGVPAGFPCVILVENQTVTRVVMTAEDFLKIDSLETLKKTLSKLL